ncbi:Hypothetical predicted protein [Octopus vulgaris]|uniref:Pirin n=2 Tax=Octopus vulgaris TaxID=6645 RepID=A0AA36AZH7_OCTVU|nr:Hypothetical predicted protein [Octopus vulgaris]
MTHKTVTNLQTVKQTHGGGFLVRKVIGGSISSCDPFIMLDHIGPVDYKPGEAVGAPDHPHRGIEIISYIIDGSLTHEDSAGNKGVLEKGWVQMMTAGQGVVHAEMPADEIVENGGRMEGFQLWINLPAKEKMIDPQYEDIPPEKIPVITMDGGRATAKLIAGEIEGKASVKQTKIPTLFLDILLEPGATFTSEVIENHACFIYIWRGSGFLGEDCKPASIGQVGLLSTSGKKVTIKASEDQSCNALLIAGEPIMEPVVGYGPFVMNTEEEIQQAILDYQNGVLGSIPGEAERMHQTKLAQALQKKNNTWADR